jgi:acyl-CoA thioester hydrolase
LNEHHSTVRVRYAETDQMAVAWHGGFFAWFEVGRTDLLRELGMTYRELESRGVYLPVVEAQARYLRPARYDDVLDISTRLTAATGVRLTFQYEVRLKDDSTLLATGMTGHAAVDGRGQPRRLPIELRGTFREERASPEL